MIAPSLEILHGWGMASFARSWVYRPRSAEEVAEAVRDARARGLTIVHRGAGQSYGDAALNEGGALIEMRGLDQILNLDPARGLVRAEAGVTIGELWRHVLPHGFWPPAVPGTMAPTLGGCVAMNVHGKNNARAGPIGEHVEAVTLLDPSGGAIELTAERDAARLATVVGAQGLTGAILEVTLRLRRVETGYLEVTPHPVRDVTEALAALDAGVAASDYAVGWLDAFGSGRGLGRGALHFARHVRAGELPSPRRRGSLGLDLPAQELPSHILGVFPKRHTWRVLRPFTNDPGMRLVNLARSLAGLAQGRQKYLQSHAAFHFLLDYVPDWKLVYAPHGLVQYQFFVPKEAAERVFREAFTRQHRAGIVSYLAVLKRHRPDGFAASYAVDGFSLALDFPVRPLRLAALMGLLRDFDAMQREVGGRIYAAKDAVSVGRLPDAMDPAYSSNLARRWAREV